MVVDYSSTRLPTFFLIQLVRQDLIQVRIHVVYNWVCFVRVVYTVCCVHDSVYNRVYECGLRSSCIKSLLTQSSYQMTRYDEATPHNHIAFYDHVVRSRCTIMLYDHVIRSCYMLCSCAFRSRFQRLRVGNRVVLDGGARVACMLGPPSWPTISTSSSSSGAFVPVVGGGMYGLR